MDQQTLVLRAKKSDLLPKSLTPERQQLNEWIAEVMKAWRGTGQMEEPVPVCTNSWSWIFLQTPLSQLSRLSHLFQLPLLPLLPR